MNRLLSLFSGGSPELLASRVSNNRCERNRCRPRARPAAVSS